MSRTLAWLDGYCASCDDDRPLAVVESGPHGFRAWLSGVGPEDRTLSYCCWVCGRSEHVPATEAEDELFEAGLVSWPDTFLVPAEATPVAAQVAEPQVVATVSASVVAGPSVAATDVYLLAVLRLIALAAAPRATVPDVTPAAVPAVPAQRSLRVVA